MVAVGRVTQQKYLVVVPYSTGGTVEGLEGLEPGI